MTQFIAFAKKEWMEIYRSGKLFLILAISVIFGIFSPAMAKLTPFIFKALGDQLAGQGMHIDEIIVTAMTSWQQFYKNLSIVIIIPVILFGSIMASEYQKGTLINMLTKGLPRWKVIAGKFSLLFSVWTIYYWMTFLITYTYTEYFWGDTSVFNIFFASMCIYILGIMMMAVVLLGSIITNTATSCILFSCGIYILMHLLSTIPKLSEYMPLNLMSMDCLSMENMELITYTKPMMVAVVVIIMCVTGAILCFNRKKL